MQGFLWFVCLINCFTQYRNCACACSSVHVLTQTDKWQLFPHRVPGGYYKTPQTFALCTFSLHTWKDWNFHLHHFRVCRVACCDEYARNSNKKFLISRCKYVRLKYTVVHSNVLAMLFVAPVSFYHRNKHLVLVQSSVWGRNVRGWILLLKKGWE